jgi:glycerophosphoryl diester phosphodiesterase
MIVAHRGYAWKHPENTLKAFQAALDAGCRWVEVDVQIRDGVPVLAHDPNVAGETLAEFAAWLDARPDATALVDFKTESLLEHGREAVVAAVMATMRGNWHPISFDYGALALAVAAGSQAPGWVVCRFDGEVLARAERLGVRWLITNQIFMPETLPAGPWEWMVYEIENREQAENAMRRGATWLETMRVGELIAAMEK